MDILHQVDLAEELAIGYGLDKITPAYPPSKEAGQFDPSVTFLESLCVTMTEAGFNETMNYDLVDDSTLYGRFGRSAEPKLEVENPRSVEHYLLRDSLIPSLMAVLGRNTKNEYPQKVFEGGRVFSRHGGQGIRETFSIAALSADSSSSFTEAKMHLQALVRRHIGTEAETKASSHWAFADGRSAQAFVNDRPVGYLGEVKPSVLAAFGVDVPVCGFELHLTGPKPRAQT